MYCQSKIVKIEITLLKIVVVRKQMKQNYWS